MKTKSPIIALLVITLIIPSCKKDSDTPTEDYKYERTSILTQSDKDSLTNIYSRYESTIKNNDQTGFTDLFIEPFSPLYILDISDNKPSTNFKNAKSWASNLRYNDYYVIIDSVIMEGYNNVALVRTKFHSNWQFIGQHLNLHIKTDKGWKIVCVNVTDEDNQTKDYFNPQPVSGTIPELIENFLSFYNKTDLTEKYNLFQTSGRIFSISEGSPFTIPSSFKQNSLATYLDSLLNLTTNTNQLALSNIDVKIVDNYLAQMVADYQVTSNNIVIEEGLQIWTMTASSVNSGWKITTMVWQKK